MAANGDLKSVLTALQKGDIDLEGLFQAGSNDTFLVKLSYPPEDFKARAVYKPEHGETPLWDFPEGTLSRREVAAFLVSQALGWELVPPTVYRRKGPLGPGSLQLYVDHDPEYHYFSFRPEHRARLQPVAAFDVIINNADRKGGHILLDANDHLWLIDHGVCFHEEDKLRTVIWDFSGQPLPNHLSIDLKCLAEQLNQPGEKTTHLLSQLLSADELQALAMRINNLVTMGIYPAPHPDRRPFPWPPV